MLVTLFSLKGSPGTTSTALALAAAWPRPVSLLEADPSGGDLAFRCRAAAGSQLSPQGGLLGVAATVRGGFNGGDVLAPHTQQLANGISLIPGVTSAVQSRGLANLWAAIAEACMPVPGDVLVDAGRLDATSPLVPLLRSSQILLPVVAASLESVMHLHDGLPEVMRMAGNVTTVPVVVGPDGSSSRDCSDVDDILGRSGLPLSTARPIPWDARALHRLESGDDPAGRLGRTLLLRSARSLTVALPGIPEEVVA